MKNTDWNSQFLKVSDFAALCGTTKDSLLWYDRIGLLKPNSIGGNSYRYYTALQQKDFDMINFLKTAGASLNEIRVILDGQNLSLLPTFLSQKIDELGAHIDELIRAKQLAERMLKAINLAVSCKHCSPCTVSLAHKTLFITEIAPDATFFNDRKKNESCLAEHLAIGRNYGEVIRYPIGNILDPDSFMNGRYQETAIFFEVTPPTQLPTKELPAGTYVQIFHKGNFNCVEETLAVAKQYILSHHLETNGNIYEYDLITFFSRSTADDMVFEFLIPVRPSDA